MNNYGSVHQAPIPLKQKRKRKRVMIFTTILLSLMLVTLLICVGVSIYIGWQLTHPEKKELWETPSDYNLVYEEFTLPSKIDQTLLSGWFIPAPDAKGTIIFAHGYRGNRLQEELPALDLAVRLHAAGYQLLLFDFRNSGLSAGGLTTIGYQEKDDLLTMVDYAKERDPDLPIGLLGFSMGASTVIIAAAESSDVQAVVADSPFANLREYLQENLPHWSELPAFPFTNIILATLPSLTGVDIDYVSPRDAIAHSTIPHLLIHGEADVAIPVEQSRQIKQAQKDAELWVVSGADHVKGYSTGSEAYANRVIQFFDQILVPE